MKFQCICWSTNHTLVDKVIIDQESFRELVNTLRPGAYVSLTKVNFKDLDLLTIKPIGVYGSKMQIVSLLLSIKVIDEATWVAFHCTRHIPGWYLDDLEQDASAWRKTIQLAPDCGLVYILFKPLRRCPRKFSLCTGLKIPHGTTTLWRPYGGIVSLLWGRDILFSSWSILIPFPVRYLTKLVDQLVCLISPKQTRSITWKDDHEDSMMEFEDDESDRLFTFEVAKTNEQEENVSVRPGFNVCLRKFETLTYWLISLAQIASREIAVDSAASTPEISQRQLYPRLVAGETSQAFLSTAYIPPSDQSRLIFDESFNSVQLHSLLWV